MSYYNNVPRNDRVQLSKTFLDLNVNSLFPFDNLRNSSNTEKTSTSLIKMQLQLFKVKPVCQFKEPQEPAVKKGFFHVQRLLCK